MVTPGPPQHSSFVRAALGTSARANAAQPEWSEMPVHLSNAPARPPNLPLWLLAPADQLIKKSAYFASKGRHFASHP
jgi:hypothetical protein